MDARGTQRLLDPLFTTETMRGIFSDHARVQAMLDFEAALARAEARAGIVPTVAATAIGAQCRAELFDFEALASGTAKAGSPVIPLIKQLTARVAASDAEAARHVHWGATTQDAMDTGLVLQLRAALASIGTDLERLSVALAALARAHAGTPLAGRTWLQQGPPVTLGLKAAGFLSAVERHRTRVAELEGGIATLQFGGAVGTLAALGPRSGEVATALADDLRLPLPDIAWHSHRDRIAEVATTFGLLAGSLGKIARDVALHSQTEVAELSEPVAEGRGGSSTMPHKQNPVAAAVVLAAAARAPGLVATMLGAMIQEDERGLGGWHAEWETLPELVGLTAGALHHLTDTMAGLRVDPARMAANLEATHGLVFAEAVQMAVAEKAGRAAAQRLLETACRRAQADGRHLREVLADDPTVGRHVSPEELERLFDPRRYIGAADALVERVLARHTAVRARAPEETPS